MLVRFVLMCFALRRVFLCRSAVALKLPWLTLLRFALRCVAFHSFFAMTRMVLLGIDLLRFAPFSFAVRCIACHCLPQRCFDPPTPCGSKRVDANLSLSILSSLKSVSNLVS